MVDNIINFIGDTTILKALITMPIKDLKSFVQTIINYLYRYPMDVLKTSIKYGGPLKKIAVNKGKKQMRNAALNLNFVNPNSHAIKIEVPICFLTGKNHWYLTAFCIYSLMKHSSGYSFKFKIFDDGTISQEISDYFIDRIPRIEIIFKNEIEKKIEAKFSLNQYPELLALRDKLFFTRKLTDIHSFDLGKILYFDSDMLFFNEPTAMINWALNLKGNFTIRDCNQSYGIDFNLMKQTAQNGNIPEKFNAGLYGIDGDKIDFALLEKWILETKNPKGLGNYYWEQALTAMLIAQDNYREAPADEYIVNPSLQQVEIKTGVLHHYVEVSQNLYYTKAWKLVI